jgi:hypothetical protein
MHKALAEKLVRTGQVVKSDEEATLLIMADGTEVLPHYELLVYTKGVTNNGVSLDTRILRFSVIPRLDGMLLGLDAAGWFGVQPEVRFRTPESTQRLQEEVRKDFARLQALGMNQYPGESDVIDRDLPAANVRRVLMELGSVPSRHQRLRIRKEVEERKTAAVLQNWSTKWVMAGVEHAVFQELFEERSIGTGEQDILEEIEDAWMCRIPDEVPIFTFPALQSVVTEPVSQVISKVIRSEGNRKYSPGLVERILDALVTMEPVEIQRGYRLSLQKHTTGNGKRRDTKGQKYYFQVSYTVADYQAGDSVAHPVRR